MLKCIILYHRSYRVLLCDTQLTSVFNKKGNNASRLIQAQAQQMPFHKKFREPESHSQTLSCNVSYDTIWQVSFIEHAMLTANLTQFHNHHYHSHQQSLPLYQLFSQLRLPQRPNERQSLLRTGSALVSPCFPKTWTVNSAHNH